MTDLRAVVFDIFGTVVDWREGVARELRAFFDRHGAGAADAYAAADAWRRRYQPAMQECRSGRRPFTRLDVLHRENLDAVLRECGIDPGAVAGGELDQLNFAWHRLDPWPDAIEGLTRLKRRYAIAPLSNGNVALRPDGAPVRRRPAAHAGGAVRARSPSTCSSDRARRAARLRAG